MMADFLTTIVFFHILLLSILTSGSLGTDEHRQERLILHDQQDLTAVVLALQQEVGSLKQQVEQLTTLQSTGSPTSQTAVTSQGSTYIRWGRTVCPSNDTDRVYYGFAAGNFYNNHGGAADFLCLTSDPKWGVYDDGDQAYGFQIYGAEYEFGNSFSDGGAKFFGQNLYQHDAPCVLCHTTRSTTIMIPGTNTCYPGWTEEYHGYLVSGRQGDPSASNYMCLDSLPETEFGDVSSDNGKLMQFVEASCGTLKCPPYVQNRELTCVVCSK